MKILYIHMAALGDGLMTSPALRMLRNHLPGHAIHVLAREHVVDYFQTLDSVDVVLPFASNRWLNRKKPYLAAGAVPDLVRLLARLGSGGYGAALQWRDRLPDTIMSALTRAPHRIAPLHAFSQRSRISVRDVPFLFTDLVPVGLESGHLIEAMAAPAVRLIEKLTGATPGLDALRMEYPVNPADEASAAKFLAGHGLADQPFACVAFSTKTLVNSWPEERFAEVADHLQQVCGLRVVLSGMLEHAAREEAICRHMRSVPVRSAGCLNLGESAVLIARSRLLVSLNSAPIHFASAFGVPTVVINGRDGASIGPWRVPHEVVTGNPHWPLRHPDPRGWPGLTEKVAARAVIAAVDRLVATTSPVMRP